MKHMVGKHPFTLIVKGGANKALGLTGNGIGKAVAAAVSKGKLLLFDPFFFAHFAHSQTSRGTK